MQRCWLALSFAAILLVACHMSTPGQERMTETITRTFSATSQPDVTATGFNGHISVTRSTDDQAHITVTKSARGQTRAEAQAHLAEVTVSFSASGPKVTVVAKHAGHGLLNPDDCAADFDLAVPQAAALHLTTSNGAITTQDVGMAVTAQTSNGNVELSGGRGAINAHTSNSRISLHPATPVVVEAKTSNGSIDLTGALASGSNRFEASNGSITLSLPAGSQFQVDAVTSNGSVSSDFPLASTSGAHSEHELHGTVGAGQGTQINARTSNGAIHIESK